MYRNSFYVDKNNQIHKDKLKLSYTSNYMGHYSKRSIKNNIHKAQKKFHMLHPDLHLTEVSHKDTKGFGHQISPFHLSLTTSQGTYPLENVYQAGKVPSNESKLKHRVLSYTPRGAWYKEKKLNKRQHKQAFNMFGHQFSFKPKEYFSDYINLCAIQQHPKIRKELVKHSAFCNSFIKPNRDYGQSSMAKTCALYVSLDRKFGQDKIKQILRHPKQLKSIEMKLNQRKIINSGALETKNKITPKKRNINYQSYQRPKYKHNNTKIYGETTAQSVQSIKEGIKDAIGKVPGLTSAGISPQQQAKYRKESIEYKQSIDRKRKKLYADSERKYHKILHNMNKKKRLHKNKHTFSNKIKKNKKTVKPKQVRQSKQPKQLSLFSQQKGLQR